MSDGATPALHSQSGDALPVPSLTNEEFAALISAYQVSRLAAWSSTGLLVICLILIGLFPVPYIKLSPGPMYNTIGSVDGKELITISGTQTYPTAGELDMMTVNERGGPFGGLTLPEAYFGWANPDDLVVPVTALYPEETTNDEARSENSAAFTSSQSAATAASLRYLNIPVTTQSTVAAVVPNGPSAGKLSPGDIINTVDGTKVAKPEEVGALIRSHKPGETVTFGITRGGGESTVPVVLAPLPTNAEQGYVGIQTGALYTGPFTIDFGSQDVGGPSAGMMFTLAIIDKLTPGELNGGKLVAGTGTMSADGKVGAIGGMQQKLAAARNHGTQLFLVPADNCDDVIAHPEPTLNIVKVSTINEAADSIKKWVSGSNDLPRCS